MSRFDKVALEIAEGIVNIPVEAGDAFAGLLEEIENTAVVPKTKKRLSAKIRDEITKIRKAHTKPNGKPNTQKCRFATTYHSKASIRNSMFCAGLYLTDEEFTARMSFLPVLL